MGKEFNFSKLWRLNVQNSFDCNDTLHPTTTALLEAADNCAYNIDQDNTNVVVFTNLKKTFDIINHNVLI